MKQYGRTIRLLQIATVAIAATLISAACVPVVPPIAAPPKPAGPIAPAVTPYTGPAVTGPENITFLYHTLAETQAAGQMSNIGHPRILAYGTTNDATVPGDAAEPAYAHSIGAKAYKYAQFTWFPTLSNSWTNTTAAQRAPWVMCRTGNVPLTDAADATGPKHGDISWSYADANERGFVNAMLAWTARLKALGYDGVFIDAGARAARGEFSTVLSTCTSQPVTPGARAADAWFHLLMLIKAQGLQVGGMNVNYPLTADPLTRPDPNNPKANKTDVRNLAFVLHENAGHPVDNYPLGTSRVDGASSFEIQAERARNDAIYGRGQIVEMAKARLPMNDVNRTRQEQYVWSLAKLSGGPVVLNTGFDFCGVPAGTTDCNRTGLNGALTDVRLGTPVDAAPYKTSCDAKGCMWVRRFQKGLVVASGYGTARRVATIPLGTATCKRITQFQGGQQEKGRCTKTITTATGATDRFAHIYLYS